MVLSILRFSILDISGGEMRGVDFEKDDDFWYAPPDRETLFIEIDGKQRSVHALTYTFCHAYLFKNPDLTAAAP